VQYVTFMKKPIIAFMFFAACSFAPARMAMLGKPPLEPRLGKPILIPTRYVEHRFIAVPTTDDNVTLSLFTDSAGGLFLYEDVVQRLQLSPILIPGATSNGQPLRSVALPNFKPTATIPPPLGSEGGRLFVFPRQQDEKSRVMSKNDGMLGQQWFAGRVWMFDYPNKRLLWLHADDLPRHSKAHEVKLGFKTDEFGKRVTNFARIPVEIDGEVMDFLFDTGATNVLSEEVLKKIGDGGPAERATSFLIRSVFEKLKKRHADWRAFDGIKTLTGSAMIEVPKIKIGGHIVGPVWFTVQSDFAFHNYMAQFTDKPTEGAIGGSALHYFQVTVDWPKALAIFKTR
jgi:hypothetical protein